MPCCLPFRFTLVAESWRQYLIDALLGALTNVAWERRIVHTVSHILQVVKVISSQSCTLAFGVTRLELFV